jgi:ATP-dependent DNA ligase
VPAPQIGDALLTLPCKGTIIDGEVVACREDGTADFRALHSGKYTQDILCVWCSDLMGLNREDLRSRSLLARKRKLAMLLRRHDHPYVRYSEPFENGFWFCAAWKAGQLGIFAMCTLYTYAWAKGLRTHWLNLTPSGQ